MAPRGGLEPPTNGLTVLQPRHSLITYLNHLMAV
jgi:hypothetical protein